MNDGWLADLSVDRKILITTFLIFVLLGYAVVGLLVLDKMDATPHGVAVHYGGNDEEMAFPKDDSALLDIVHPHLHAIPMLLLLTGAIFTGTRVRPAIRGALFLAAALAIALSLAGLFLIRQQPGFAWLVVGAGFVEALAVLVFCGGSLREMWRPQRDARQPPG